MSNFAHRFRGWLVDYKWRFAPLVHMNLARRDRNTIPLTINITKEEVDSQLQSVLRILSSEFAPLDFHKRIPAEQRARATELLTKHLSFALVRKSSSLKGCGQGIFVAKGPVPALRVVALYSGTIYDPWDSILLQSIGNHFVLRCQDGVTIDGNDVRLSRWIHRSCAYRDLSPAISDLTWLEDTPFNYLNMGHYVNNEPAPNAHNVQYVDLDIHQWPLRLRKFLPYSVYSPHRVLPLRVVVLVSVREIAEGEELFSAYVSR
ncbi:unnamed protein product [Cylicocyclus nassatus]|uniref:SET domain-containing protein n=1 Tax=Cylicocyclus nassatus TaxID=53992 RepID=A0AA36GYQ5_CYLNA|nr:unnamed protein product [Cylicocyclus nassatus]